MAMQGKLGPLYLPGDPVPAVEAMIRVDHAGEYGAVRIYEGQLAVLPPGGARDAVLEMAAQEGRHLETFEKLIVERQVRPTILSPLWRVAGFALGAATARMGPRAAMACTVAVEEVIDEHYREQAERLGAVESELKSTIEEFRAEELEHRDTALDHGAERAVGYLVLSALVKSGSRMAIWLSTRI
jgi:ubiquinone biosynthesis monooxygenase Coq7